MKKVFKFGTVGGICLVIDFTITFFLIRYYELNVYSANAIGFITSASINMWINRIWTFKNKQNNISRQYILFMLIALLALLINSITLFLSQLAFHAPFFIHKGVAVITTFIWNYNAHNKYTFSQRDYPQTILYKFKEHD